MVGTCEKMSTSISSSTTNEWPQNQILDDQKSFMASSIAANKAMERSIQDPLHQPHKCPRCDSSDTKFCYYNNYSLSQPRHFCKSCKRYWTRGGTLRNVPVGGGCRKNKKVKRQPSNGGGDGISSAAAAAAASTATIKPSVQPDIDLSPTSNSINNPLFYNMPTNPLELNFPFSRFSTTRVSSEYDHQPQINGLGIGFSSGLMISELQNSDYKNGFKQIFQDVNSTTSSPSLLSAADNNLVFFGSSNNLASSLQQQRFVSTGLKDIQASNDFPGLMPYKDMQMLVGNGGVIGKESKIEGEYRLERNQNQIEQINSSDYSSSLLWNTNNIGAWFDPSNMGTYSSVPSLI